MNGTRQEAMQDRSAVTDILDSFHGMLCIKEPSGEILFANRYMREVLGFDPTGRCLDMGLECIGEGCQRSGGESLWKYGDRLFLFVESQTRWNASDAVAMIGYDITDSNRMEVELQAARDVAESSSAAKTRFLATMSHEIRTPLNAIMGMADIMLKTDLDERQIHYARTIKSSSCLLLKIIKDILDFSKIEAGKMGVEDREFDLADVVTQTVDTLRSQAEKKGLALFANIAPDVPSRVRSDPGKIQQVLVNLLGNAIKFTENGFVTLTVLCRPESDRPFQENLKKIPVLLQVQDSGVGIPADQLDSIFSSFTQVSAHSGPTREFGGTGLGLSICRKILHLLGGDITVSSIEGVGSTFVVELPLEMVSSGQGKRMRKERECTEAESEVRLGPCAGSERERLAVLVVEDNPMNAEVTRLFLEQIGHSMHLAENGAQALNLLREGDFHLVLMDLELPDMNGNEVTAKIRNGLAGERNASIPIVSMTAHAFVEIRSECLEAGADAYLSKPVELETLQACLERTMAGAGSDISKVAQNHVPGDSVGPVLDRDKKLAALGGDGEVLRKLYSLFLRDVPGQLETLQDLVDGGEVRQIADLAHTIKGSAAIIGAGRAKDLASSLEQFARKREVDTLQECFFRMRQEYCLVLDTVRGFLENPDFG
ncbi:MAG TPA: ATP-binding protein [Desulfomicrobiaceae bacterium]|nr:ATP-binding protein [Desulfomicrobiaceae bacterium]